MFASIHSALLVDDIITGISLGTGYWYRYYWVLGVKTGIILKRDSTDLSNEKDATSNIDAHANDRAYSSIHA